MSLLEFGGPDTDRQRCYLRLLRHRKRRKTRSCTACGYWDEVRKLLAGMIGDAAVDYILLISSHAHDRGLVQALEGAIAGCDDINPAVLDRYIQSSASEQDKQEALFASANQAAVSAMFGMLTGYEACLIPEHCPVDEDNEFEEEDWWSILGIPNTEGIN